MKFNGTANYIDKKYDTSFSITPKNFIYNDLSTYGMKIIKIPLDKIDLSYRIGKSSDDQQYEVLDWRGEWIGWANCHLGVKIQTWNRKEIFITSVGLKSIPTVNGGYRGKDIDLQSSIITLDHKSYFYFDTGFIPMFAGNCGTKDTERIKNDLVAKTNYLSFLAMQSFLQD